MDGGGIGSLFDINRFMPHGHCYQWEPGILWTSVISDTLIAAAYVAIPFTLVFQIMRKRRDLPFNWMFVCFGLFIVACGLTHVMEIITVWKPHYAVSAIVKAITAAASVPTAITLFRIAPQIVKLPTLDQMVQEHRLRLRAEAASEAKDQFLAVLSHELRTPLTPVKIGLDVLEDELRKCQDPTHPVGPGAYEALRMIRHNLEMETILINDLLDLSASARGNLTVQFHRVDLKDVLGRSLPLIDEDLRRKHIRLHLEADEGEAIVMGADVRLHQIISNLLVNAVKFTAEQGAITVSLQRAGRWWRLSVTDTGCGIAPEDLEKIFRPFEQAKRNATGARAGLGLGLAIAKTLAELHNGRLTVMSAGRDQGSTFTLELPGAGQAQLVDGDPPSADGAATSETDKVKPRVLLVEDHADTLRTIALLLRRSGYAVETAQNVQEAEPFLSETDVLISDIGLPDGNGWDLMSRFRRIRKGGGGIAISGLGQEEDIRRSRRAGFAEHLVKPVDINRLRDALLAFARSNTLVARP